MGDRDPAIGIDLGTTFSCVGVFQHGKVEIIANDQGNRTTPSYVAFTDTEILIGDAAKNQSTKNLKNTIFDVKRIMGRKFDFDDNDIIFRNDVNHWPFKVVNENTKPKIKVKICGASRTYCPEEISAMVLRKMKETAEDYLGKPVKNAVITVPAYFNDSQRGATIDAAKIAGLNVLRIINEPTAAAIAYGLERKDSGEQTVLVFDLGGGTFDVSILTIQNGIFEVKSTAGDTHLGGEDFDSRMVNHFVKECKKIYNVNINENERALRRLRIACEGAKRILSSALRADISIDSLFNGTDFNSWISRAPFEQLNADYFRSIIALVEKAISDAKLHRTQIDHVVLVGGSSRIPKIRKILQDFFGGKELYKSINPDEAVAYGATVQAAILNGDKSEIVENVVLVDVLPLSLGVGVGPFENRSVSVILPRNTVIPAKETRDYGTLQDNQTSLFIAVYEGEHIEAKKNHLLGEFSLYGIPPAPAGVHRIDETFEIDANGILNITAVERSTGVSKQLTIKHNKNRLSEEEINRMIEDADEHQTDEKKQKEAIFSMNALESYCIDVKSSLADKHVFSRIEKKIEK
ncbi:heat shock 70 kDa protein cognate 4-like [Planococcus citri]|uniref:heat shock 70 kDa protein cognate 4-like n=1 Tax=Planococcus citri TaxID=170843 RepID=UPI0031F7F80E